MTLRQQLAECDEEQQLSLDDVAKFRGERNALREELAECQAMYDAQCVCTDEWAEKCRTETERKADTTLLRRLEELEHALSIVNGRLAECQAQIECFEPVEFNALKHQWQREALLDASKMGDQNSGRGYFNREYEEGFDDGVERMRDNLSRMAKELE